MALLLLLGDVAALYTALGITLLIRYGTDVANPWEIHKLPFTIVFTLWLFIFYTAGLYDQNAWNADRSVKERILRSIIAAGITAVILFYFVPAFVITPKTNLFIQIFISIIFIGAWRIFASILIRNTFKKNILFFGISQEGIHLANVLADNPHLGYCVAAVVQPNENISPTSSFPTIPVDQNILRFITEKNISLVIASRDIRSEREFVRMLYNVLPLGIRIMDFPTFYEMITGKIPVSLISEVWFLENLIGSRKWVYETEKRLFDIFLAIIIGGATLILSPFILVGIILSTPREVLNSSKHRARPGDGIIFFRQKRVGKNGRIFNFIKFRSQRLGSERMSQAKEIENDPRQFLFGKFLRAFYLDELPQVWNVLTGDMSFIGPRPERPTYVAELAKTVPFYEIRLLVPPGITGWAQINMKNDASVEDAPKKMQYDLYYIKNRSFALDLNIALKTFWVMLSREGR